MIELASWNIMESEWRAQIQKAISILRDKENAQ